MKKNTQLNEISTNRLLSHFTDGSTLAIISSFRTERTEAENMALLQKLKRDVRALQLGFTELKSRWAEMADDGTQQTSDERSLIIYGISLSQAMAFGEELQQASIIFKNAEKCAEVCTTEFTDWQGKRHVPGNVVQTFNLRGATPFNTAMARDIVEKRRGGPVSIPLKSNRPFTLSEVDEVVQPSGATFSKHEKYVRVL